MNNLQSLFEGISINNELVGLITYIRTDSKRLAPEFIVLKPILKIILVMIILALLLKITIIKISKMLMKQ